MQMRWPGTREGNSFPPSVILGQSKTGAEDERLEEIPSHTWSFPMIETYAFIKREVWDDFSWREVSWSLPLDAEGARYEEGQLPQLWEWWGNQLGWQLNVEFLWRGLRLWILRKSMGCSRQESWSGLPLPPPGDLPDPGIEAASLESAPVMGRLFTSEPLGEPCVPTGRPVPFLLSMPGNLASSLTSSHSFLWPLRSPLLSS